MDVIREKECDKAPLIVVSNRLPFVLNRNADGSLVRKSSAGGLVTAVAPVVIDCKGIWVGWTGLDDFNEKLDNIPESEPKDVNPTSGLLSSQTAPVEVMPSLFNDYYNGCCNGTLWPLFHSMPDRAVFSSEYWKSYVSVNDIFALRTLRAIRSLNEERLRSSNSETPRASSKTPIVWLHDYQLMVAANKIRNVCVDEGIEIRMGFFLHIPFPTYDILRICPWSDEILMGILGCDLVAFHIEDYSLNFMECCQRSLGSRYNRNTMIITHLDREIRIKTLPIGIPYEEFENLSKTSETVYKFDCKVILGVDRLDYTKGLVARMNALERLFQKYPQWIGKVNFLQVAVPSRTLVKEYQELKETIDKLVGQINGAFSTPTWSPIRYIYGSLTQDNLAAFYRDANVALVTPLRDGMNLVAKEFVACQNDSDPGVLILSPFAGAGVLMHEALSANPYEPDNVAQVLHRALEMPLDERQLRMNLLKKREKRNDVKAWVNGFLLGMEEVFDSSNYSILDGSAAEASSSKSYRNLLTTDNNFDMIELESRLGRYVEKGSKLGIILDFDGTLACLARTPNLAIMAPSTQAVLSRLSKLSDVHVAVISGRKLKDLKAKVNVEGVTYAGNHGLEILHPDGSQVLYTTLPKDYKERLRLLLAELKASVETDGAWIEDKDLLVAWHFREVSIEKRDSMVHAANEIYKKHNFTTIVVSKRIENTPPDGWDRGCTCITILRSLFGLDWEERVKVIYAGDSAADEIAITRLKGVAYTFRVNNEDSGVITKTMADYRLQGSDGVLNLLKFLEKKMLGRSRTLSIQSIPKSHHGSAEKIINENTSESEDELRPDFRRRTVSADATQIPTSINLCKSILNRTVKNRLHSNQDSS